MKTIKTVKELVDAIYQLPSDTQVQVYNKEAMRHTPIGISVYNNRLIIDSAVIVTVEDYD